MFKAICSVIDDSAPQKSDSSPDFRSRTHGVSFSSGELLDQIEEKESHLSEFWRFLPISSEVFQDFTLN